MLRTAALACLFLISACSSDTSPEEQFQLTLEEMEAAAENRDLGKFMQHVSENYIDDNNRRHADIEQVARLYFIRHKNLHIYRHVTQLDFHGDHGASAIIYVAVGANPIDSADSLASVRADLIRFKVRFEREDSWKIISSEWQRASAGDFL